MLVRPCSNDSNISPSSVQLCLPLLCLARCCSARDRRTNPTFHRTAYNFARLCSALLGAALLGVVKRIQHFTEQRTTLLAFALPCSVLLCSGSSNEYNISPNSVQLCSPLLCLARCCSARGRQTNTTFRPTFLELRDLCFVNNRPAFVFRLFLGVRFRNCANGASSVKWQTNSTFHRARMLNAALGKVV